MTTPPHIRLILGHGQVEGLLRLRQGALPGQTGFGLGLGFRVFLFTDSWVYVWSFLEPLFPPADHVIMSHDLGSRGLGLSYHKKESILLSIDYKSLS